MLFHGCLLTEKIVIGLRTIFPRSIAQAAEIKILMLQDSSHVLAALAQEGFVLLTSYSVTACYKVSYVSLQWADTVYF